MSGKTVIMLYTGIIGFVPSRRSNTYRVVVQNATGAEMPHWAWIAVDRDDVVCDDGLKEIKCHKGAVAYALPGGDVEIGSCVRPKVLRVHHSFHQDVLDLAAGCLNSSPGSERIDPRYLYASDSEVISARFLIAGGSLYAFADPRVQWRWVGMHSSWRHIAQVVVHVFAIEEDTLSLWMGPHASLEIKAYENGEYIFVAVGNTTYHDIFVDNPIDEPLGPAHHGERDPHVRLYFDLSAVSYPTEIRPSLKRHGDDEWQAAIRKGESLSAEEQLHAFKGVLSRSLSGPLVDWLKVVILRLGGSNCPPGLWAG